MHMTALLCAAGFLVGCASGAAQQQKEKKGSDDPQVAQATQTASCSRLPSQGEESDLRLHKEGPTRLDGFKLDVTLDYEGRQRSSFCDLLDTSGAKVGIFQFAGVTCSECRDHGEDFRRELRGNRDIAHIVIITDHPGEYQDWEVEDFKKTYTSGIVGFDQARWWRHFNKDRKVPNRAAYYIMRNDMNAIVSNREGLHADDIVRLADGLLKSDNRTSMRNGREHVEP